MSAATPAEDSLYYLSTFRRYVLDPIDTALQTVNREHQEITAECDAFEAFASRVEEIPSHSPDAGTTDGPLVIAEPRTKRIDRLRGAYEDTIMSMSHFDTVYGESLKTNLSTEFSPDIAALFDHPPNSPFTREQKQLLQGATKTRIDERDDFSSVLESERRSLHRSDTELKTILDTLDSTHLPSWHQDDFDDIVENILDVRQDTINSRPSQSRLDGHDLCAYLYDEQQWSYPVLTGIARLLDVVDVKS